MTIEKKKKKKKKSKSIFGKRPSSVTCLLSPSNKQASKHNRGSKKREERKDVGILKKKSRHWNITVHTVPQIK